ncbi:rod shape-determining protein MreC [Candidatus Nomurabacteria bacterium]|nr:rod shape-determining protein MreC [Candidatus Nomurabacteria bacterium]
MNYLLDKNAKRKKFFQITALLFICLILFYFRSDIFRGLSYASHAVFRPILVLGNNFGDKFRTVRAYFSSKNSLFRENENLKMQMNEDQATVANYNSILVENISLKEILERKDPKTNMTLSAILSKPNQNLYDTLIIDAGIKQGIKVGDTVFALGNIPIGRVSSVYNNSAKVVLFSNLGEKTQAMIVPQNIFMEIVGRGGGNFEMILPRDLTLTKGDQAILPGIATYVLGLVETIISDPRNPFVKALLVSPVNTRELKFVEVEKQK